MSNQLSPSHSLFPVEVLAANPGDDLEFIRQTAQQFSNAITRGVLWSLGANKAEAVPGADQLGGLLFIARILPLRDGKRHQRAASTQRSEGSTLTSSAAPCSRSTTTATKH